MLALGELGDQSLIRFGEFRGATGDALLQHLGEIQQLGFRALLSGQIPANRSYIHRTSGARIIDPKAIDQKRGCGPGLAMAEFDLTAPPSDLHDDRPNLATRALALLRDDKIKDAREERLFHLTQTDMLQSG